MLCSEGEVEAVSENLLLGVIIEKPFSSNSGYPFIVVKKYHF